MFKKNVLLSLSVVLLLLLAGCAQVSVNSTVTADQMIEEYRMDVETSRTVYEFLKNSAEEEGYDSIGDSLLSDIDRSRVGEVTYDEEFDDDSVTMTITMKDFSPSASGNISVTEEDGLIVYEDLTFVEEDTQSDMEYNITSDLAVDYTLTMPGKIVESNADSVDGNTAEWHATGSDAFSDTRIYAKSEISSGLFGDLVGLVLGVGLFGAVVVGGYATYRSGRLKQASILAGKGALVLVALLIGLPAILLFLTNPLSAVVIIPLLLVIAGIGYIGYRVISYLRSEPTA